MNSSAIGANLVYDAPVPNKDAVNSALTYYCQVGDPTDKRLRAVLHLFSQIAKEPAFNQLRTKEQLGYMVFSGHWQFTGTMGFRITVQSERHPVYLESRVDSFLQQLQGTIDAMTAEEFDRQRQSVIDKKLTKLKNLHVVQHGLDANGNDKYDLEALGESSFAKSLGVNGIPEEATNPATCGTVTGASTGEMPSGGVDTGDGTTGGIEAVGTFGLAGAAIAAAGGALIYRRRLETVRG